MNRISIAGAARRGALCLLLAAGAVAWPAAAGSLPAGEASEAAELGEDGGQEKSRTATVTLAGTVSVTRGGDQITSISLVVRQGKQTAVYQVALDNMGRQLAAYHGKSVSVAGTLRGSTLTVTKIG